MRKQKCDYLNALSVFKLKEWGYLSEPRSGTIYWGERGSGNSLSFNTVFLNGEPSEARVDYVVRRDDPIYREYGISLTSTDCNFGGKRYWFVCPLVLDGKACERRVAKLYFDNTWFGCRHCHDLAYNSQYEYWGTMNGSFKNLARVWDLEEQISGLRVKYWKGRPTKKYQKLLDGIHRSHRGMVELLND